MKYAIIIPDGAADQPLVELDGKTPLQVARKPNMDRLGEEGRQGTVATTPEGMSCGSDVCIMSLLGYDPRKYHRGRAPLEAAALGIEMTPADWVFRVNLVTVIDGKMQDHSAGHITSEEGRRLLSDFAQRLELPGLVLYPGVSYRNIMVDVSGREGQGPRAKGQGEEKRGEKGEGRREKGEGSGGSGIRELETRNPKLETGAARDWSELVTTPPHDIPGEPIRKYLPVGGPHAALLGRIIAESEVFFREHEINLTRRELGELPATHLWPWGQGQKPAIPSFESRFGLKGAMITAVDLLAGISQFIGWDRLDVPGQTSYHDTDYAAAGKYGIAALDQYDVVCIHVEAPDEASHASDAKTKIAAIEAIDQHIVGPVRAALEQRRGEWRLLVLPDHYTDVATRKHDATPVPFVLAGKNVHSVLRRPFCEASAAEADLHVKFGHELMEYFLFSGLD